MPGRKYWIEIGNQELTQRACFETMRKKTYVKKYVRMCNV